MGAILASFLSEESGAAAIEYGAILALLTALIIPAANMLGGVASEALAGIPAALTPGPGVHLE